MLLRLAAIGVAIAAPFAVPATALAPTDYEISGVRVSPATAYFAGEPVRIRFTATDERERTLQVRLIERTSRRVVHSRRVPMRPAGAGRPARIEWDGISRRGKVVAEGRYIVRAGPVGRPSRKLGALSWRHYAYPVDGPHADRPYLGEFGAPRSGGRRHEGFDILAACGTRIVAVRGGRVTRSEFDPELHGHYVVIRGRRDGMRQRYSHLRRRSPMRAGERVLTGQKVGRVGQTGNAATTPCHLHFELRKGGPLDPEPYLDRWDR